MLTLEAGDCSLTLAPEIGGAIAGWTLGPHHVLRPALPDAIVQGVSRGLSAYPLVPFSNRINNARFSWEGRDYQLARNFGDEPHAIHGVGWQSIWNVAELSQAAARLTLDWDPAVGDAARHWPFAFSAAIGYALRPDGLTVAMSVTSRHTGPAPVGLGLHPFFPRTEQASLRFQADGVWKTGSDHMPTECVPVPPEWDHSAGRAVGSAVLDNLFTGWPGTAEITLAPTPVRVRLSGSASLRRLVVYEPEGKPYFAAEPVSHETDAINRTGDTGLVTLEPGKTFEVEIRFELF